jgi:hypothetical protein
MEWGLAKTVLNCVARVGQATIINMPLFLLAYLLRDKEKVFERKYLMTRLAGYIHHTLYRLAPNVFPLKGFDNRLKFRNERKIFIKE